MRRLPARVLLLALLAAGAGMGAGAARAQTVLAAAFATPTARYDQGVLGDALEWGALELTVADCADCAPRRLTVRLPETRVFEDLSPRIVTGPGGADFVMVVETDLERGASLALYDASGRRAHATPFLGQAYRWLAPVGVADLDGDGTPEIAYVETPHLGRTLRIWRWTAKGLTPVAALEGLSNHRIGQDFISGGIRDCGRGPEIVTADASWRRIMAVRLVAGRLRARPVAEGTGQAMFARVMGCDE
ncbi:FG-GAP repeat domain-containing protein [Profundibacter sp.]